MASLIFVVLAVSTISPIFFVEGYSSYQKRLPNGEKIPHPCKPNTLWTGVGHISQFGGGKRNPFGNAFANAGRKWTKQLCEADSDGDGKTNGEELGDPNCVWTEGQTPVKTTGLSHPGVCEPVDSAKCKWQKWISCSGQKATCNAINQPGTKSHVVRFPKTKVPAKVTTYWCKTFKLPADQPYHIVATEPVLDNTKVIHHMIIYGCEGEMEIDKDPFNCIMASSRCHEMLAGWTVGDEDYCLNEKAGVRFGKNSIRYVQLQVHWTNEAKADDYYDSSGIKLFYTPKLRKYDQGVMTVGQMHLELPPGQKKLVTEGVCEPYCTKRLLGNLPSVNITDVLMHAHFLGRNLTLAQYRNGKFIRYLGLDDAFSYNNPKSTIFDPPVVFYPGDQLKTTCIYDTTSKKKTTLYGDGTFDEMCYGFVNYYPKLKTRSHLCVSYERYSYCDLATYRNASFYEHKFGSCNFTDFQAGSHVSNVIRACGLNPKVCTKDCRYFVNQLDTHRCMKGAERKIHDDRWLWREGKAIRVVSKAIEVCEKKTSIDSSDVSMTVRPKNTNIDSAGVSMTVMPKYMLLFAAVVTTSLLV